MMRHRTGGNNTRSAAADAAEARMRGVGGGSSRSNNAPAMSSPKKYTSTLSYSTSKTKSKTTYQDPVFAGMFVVQFLIMSGFAFRCAQRVLSHPEGEEKDFSSFVSNDSLISFGTGLAVSTLVTFMITILWFFLVTYYNATKRMIQFAFFATPIGGFIFGLGYQIQALRSHGLEAQQFQQWAFNSWSSAASSAIMLGVLYSYARQYIPFAASNLHVALVSLRSYPSLYVFAMIGSVCQLLWIVTWSAAAMEIYMLVDSWQRSKDLVPCGYNDYGYPLMKNGKIAMCQDKNFMPQIIAIGFTLSLYWTLVTIPYILQTTVAGVVGSWWNGTPNTSMSGALQRSLTTSFGSICFGSLLVAVLQTIEYMLESMKNRKKNQQQEEGSHRRQSGDRTQYQSSGGVVFIEFLLKKIRALTEYFNAWAFCFVGINGSDYLTSGREVTKLFRDRGLTSIISDRLVYRVIGLCKWGIGLLSGMFVYLYFTTLDIDTGAHASWGVFAGSLVGILLATSSVSIVECAVRTVIVLFSARPESLEAKYPDLSLQLKTGWAEAYPDEWRNAHYANGYHY